MLHQQAGYGDPNPAAGAQGKGGTAGLHQLDNIGVETDGSHGQDNEKLAEGLDGGEDTGIHPKGHGDGGDEAGKDEVEDEKGEDGAEFYLLPALFLPALCLQEGKNQDNGDDGQGAGELHSNGFVQGGAAQPPHTVPRGGGGSDRRGVVHGGTCKNAEPLARRCAKA